MALAWGVAGGVPSGSMAPPQLIVLALLALGLQGCLVSRATFNEPLAREALAQLEVGRSDATDVVRLLGAPTEVVQLGLRFAHRYDHTVTKRTGLILIVVGFLETQTRSDRSWLFFDEQGRLTHHGTTFEAGAARYGMPWQ
jgi:hypothetical protein